MNSPPLTPKKTINQAIKYTGPDSEYSMRVTGQDVTVQCNSGEHSHGSSKVKLVNRIDYNWEFQYYRGNLISVHIAGKLIAYGMKGKDGGMVRVTNQETGQRALIKNLKTDVKDVAFAFSRAQVTLGCIDEEGNVMVYEIIDERTAIRHNLLLHIFHRDFDRLVNFRLIWCPYYTCFDDEEEEGDEAEKMFVVLNGDKAEIFNFGAISRKYGVGPIESGTFEEYVEIGHGAELVDASFSSDGNAIAIACSDGYVKFFQINMEGGNQQKCLHKWRPHDRKPLSSIIFVDNLLDGSSQCWKFTITGANFNSELKLWSCENWTCLQTLHFLPHPKNVIHNVYFKISIDYRGEFLIMSDINNKALYVLQLKRNDDAQQIAVTTLSQFLLPAAFLSFHITQTAERRVRISDSEDYQDDEDDEDDLNLNPSTVIDLLIIQIKKLQVCNIVFESEKMLAAEGYITTSEKLDTSVEKLPKLDDLQSSVTLLIQQQQQMTLLPPDAFNAEQKVEKQQNGDEKVEESVVDNLIDFQRPEKDNFASGGSSPSREVQEILSLNNSNYATADYFDNLTKIEDEEDQPEKAWISKMNHSKASEQNVENSVVNSLNEGEWSKTHIQAINFRLTTIENAISDQNLLMEKIHQELKNKENKEQIGKDIDLAMSKQQLQIAKMLENLINMQKTSEREKQEQIVGSISQIVTKSVSDKLQAVVVNEMKVVVIPTVRNLVEAVKHQLDVQNSQKLNSDLVLQEKISKCVNVKALSDSLSLSVANLIKPILEKSYRDMIQSTLIPSWEKITANLFHQVNETFTKGTKEYTQSLDSYMERQRRVQERGKDLVVQMQQATETVQNTTEKLSSALAVDLQKQINGSIQPMHDILLQNVKEVIDEQIKAGFKAHASVLEDSVMNAVRSRAVTPTLHGDTQATLAQIDHLLGKECYDDAFQWALSAENLNIVIYVCEKVDPNVLFASPCVIQQNCILALIQQLSMELPKTTELKLSYIRGALVALTPGYPNTKQFIPKVLKDLQRQLQIFMSTNPNSKFVNDVKLIKMVVESILNK